MLTVCFVWVGTHEEIQWLGRAISSQKKDTKVDGQCVLKASNQKKVVSHLVLILKHMYVSDLASPLLKSRECFVVGFTVVGQCDNTQWFPLVFK